MASTTKFFASLHGLAKRERIQFRINTMLETLILQGCSVREPVEYTTTNQKIGIVGTIFAGYANEISRKKSELRKTLFRETTRFSVYSDIFCYLSGLEIPPTRVLTQ